VKKGKYDFDRMLTHGRNCVAVRRPALRKKRTRGASRCKKLLWGTPRRELDAHHLEEGETYIEDRTTMESLSDARGPLV